MPPRDEMDRFARVRKELGIGHLLLEAQESRMDHRTPMPSVELMGKSVIPVMHALPRWASSPPKEGANGR